jgi:hypothetical protein
MTSNLGCVGLGVDDMAGLAHLLADLIPASTATRQADGSALYVWRDTSGAMLTITTDRAGAIDDVTPSYDGERGAVLGALTALHDRVVAADVLVDGDRVTRLACEVLPPGPVPASGPATLTAFGLDVSFHASAADFRASSASLLVTTSTRRRRSRRSRRSRRRSHCGWEPSRSSRSGSRGTTSPVATSSRWPG